jgi:uncharacterized protein (DUF1501 family)
MAKAIDREGLKGPLVSVSPGGSAALEGGQALAIQMSPVLYHDKATPEINEKLLAENETLRRIVELGHVGTKARQELQKQLAPLPSGLQIPSTELGIQVQMALRLIGAKTAPPAIQMSQSGYDTHSDQRRRHARVLEDLGKCLAGFYEGLQVIKDRPQVTVLVTSEFGRRLKENRSNGTDHGNGSVAIILGDHIPGQFIGDYPALNKLDDRGDLKPLIRPPDLYKKVLGL